MTPVAWPVLTAVGVVGLAVGSFLNVVIYRVPRGESVNTPGSHCPSCHAAIKARHNVPLLSWLALRGKCSSCRAPISVRYPLVELGTALLWLAITLRFGLTVQLPAYLLFGALAITLPMIDMDLRRLPDVLVGPAYVLAGLLLVPAAAASNDWHSLVRAASGMILLAGLYAGLRLAGPRHFAPTAAKLAGLIGIYLGWLSWAAVGVGGAIGLLAAAAVVGATALIQRRDVRSETLVTACGPCLFAGAAVAVFATVPLVGLYSSFAGAS
jgi:leader peptidase (prepilin peptidase)/N-methyltransferase